MVTPVSNRKRDAPSTWAASSTVRSMDANPARSERMYSGAATNVWASTTANVVNGMLMPTTSRDAPRAPRRPNASSSASPATVGGRMMGRSTSTSASHLPRKSRRARSSAEGCPEDDGQHQAGERRDEAQDERVKDRLVGGGGQQLLAQERPSEQRGHRQAQEQQPDDRQDDARPAPGRWRGGWSAGGALRGGDRGRRGTHWGGRNPNWARIACASGPVR